MAKTTINSSFGMGSFWKKALANSFDLVKIETLSFIFNVIYRKKFPLIISPVNVTKSAETADLVTFTEKSLTENFFRAVRFMQFHSK